MALSPCSSSIFSPCVHASGTDAVYDNSNDDVFGRLFGTPIINLPQAAVLDMHTIKDKPVVSNGLIVIRPIMVPPTCHHWLMDGRGAVTFLG